MDLLRKWGLERIMANSAADWGIADPCSLAKVAAEMKQQNFTPQQIEKFLFYNPYNFYRQHPRFKGRLDLSFTHPGTTQHGGAQSVPV